MATQMALRMDIDGVQKILCRGCAGLEQLLLVVCGTVAMVYLVLLATGADHFAVHGQSLRLFALVTGRSVLQCNGLGHISMRTAASYLQLQSTGHTVSRGLQA